jgi:hypothetical protein
MRELLLTALAWIPLWIIALALRARLRGGHILMGAALAAFVGGMCAVELRRHGLLAIGAGSVPLIVFGLRLDEILHFALMGAGGVLLTELFLDRADIGR